MTHERERERERAMLLKPCEPTQPRPIPHPSRPRPRPLQYLRGCQQQSFIPLVSLALSPITTNKTEIEIFNSHCCQNDYNMCLLHFTNTSSDKILSLKVESYKASLTMVVICWSCASQCVYVNCYFICQKSSKLSKTCFNKTQKRVGVV